MRRVAVTIFLLLLCSVAMAQIPVTFQVDLRILAKETIFNPLTDSVTIHGDFMTDAGLGSNWFPNGVKLGDPNNDTVYTGTVNMDTSKAGTTYHYKFTVNDSRWEGDPNREFVLEKPSVTLPVVWFDRDSVLRFVAIDTLNFTADLSPYYGTGAGFFDPATDSLVLQGLDWVGATVIGGNRTFKEDPFSPGTFHCTMAIKGYIGDSTKWKTRAFPNTKFANDGWEFTNDKWYHITADGVTANIPSFIPDIWPAKAPTAHDVKVLFQVNTAHAANRYTDQPIDHTQLQFVGIKGQHSVLGAWVGDWLPADTAATPKNLLVLNDSGLNGDKVAGDGVWSILVTFPSGDPGGPFLYKYGAFYPGYDTVNSGYHPADNEMKPDINHYFILQDVPVTEIFNEWGTTSSVVNGVEAEQQNMPVVFSLSQNFPNPFNPTTTIKYSVPENSDVSLTLYNLLGQKVSTLYQGHQKAGAYSVEVRAQSLATGVYFYRLQAGSNVAIKKMLLLK